MKLSQLLLFLIVCSCEMAHGHSIDACKRSMLIPPPDSLDIEIIPNPNTDTIWLEIEVQAKDWWEDIYLVRKSGRGKERIFEKPIPLTTQSILFASFVNIQFNKAIFFEVYDITHQGNGYYNLFEYKEGILKLLLKLRAVDRHQEQIGINSDSSFIIKGDRLESEYIDINKDGYKDIRLTGIGYVIQGAVISEREKSSLRNPINLERFFIWNEEESRFKELVSERKGFWYYDEHEIEY